MSKGFNLTAELNLRGPSNIRTVVADIRKQVGSVSVNINPTVNRQSIRNVANTIRTQLANVVCDVRVRANTASLRSIGTDIRRQLGGVTANVNIRANQSSIRTAAADIRRQLGSISTNVNVRFNTSAVTTYSNNLRGLNNNLTQITASATNATAAINALSAAMRGASAAAANINNAAINVGNINRAAGGARNSVALATNEMVEFGRQSGLAFRRFSAITTVTSVIYGLTNAVSQGVKSFIDFDLQMTRIAQVTGDAKDKLGDVANTITGLSTTLGVSSSDLTKTTVTLAQAGLTAKETATALKALALSALAPSFDDMNQTVEGSIALMRQFGIGANQLEQALGSVNAVSAKFAVEASDIITAIQRTGGVFAAASKGVSSGTDALNEFIAVFTSIRATTRESAETIATGLRTIFTRIQRADTIEALKEFGVTLTDLEGKFVGPYIAVQRLSEGLSRLDPRDLKFSQIVEELGGFRQIGKVLPLIQQFATAQDALKIAQQGQGSLASDAAKGQLALAVQIQKVREEFQALIRSIGETSTFQNMVKLGLDLASALIKVADATKGIVPLLGMFAAFKGISAATQYIGGFGQGIRGRAARGSAEGGRIYAFASGGLVPGSGDHDSISARLTPGEFVMRKSAVRSIGASNLSRMNNGGIIQRFAKGSRIKPVDPKEYEQSINNAVNNPNSILNQSSVGVAILKGPKTALSDSRISKNQIIKSLGKQYGLLLKSTASGSVNVVKEALSPDVYKVFNDGIEDGLVNAINTAVGALQQRFPQLPVPAIKGQQERQKYLKGVNDAAKGNLFEEILTSMKNKGVYDSNPDPQRPFDFSPGKESAQFGLGDIFGKLSKLLYVDAKASNPSDANVAKKIANQILRDIGVVKGRQQKPETTDITAIEQQIRQTLNSINKGQALSLADIQSRIPGARDKQVTAIARELGLDPRNNAPGAKRNYIRKSIGGIIQKFANAGPVIIQRGVIDGDALRDEKYSQIVRAEMEKLGISDIRDYKTYLDNYAASKNTGRDRSKFPRGQNYRLTQILGVKASGKSTQAGLATGGKKGRLRETSVFPVLSTADIDRANHVVSATSVEGPSQLPLIKSVNRAYVLSSRHKDSQQAILDNEKYRDQNNSSTLFGRKPGATKGASSDSGYAEAFLAANIDDPNRVITRKVVGRGKYTRIDQPTVRSPERTLLHMGNFGPSTAGHIAAAEFASKKSGIAPQDAVILVSGDASIDFKNPNDQQTRTAILPQQSKTGPSRLGMAQATFGSRGFNVAATPKGTAPGAIPNVFKIGEDSYIVPRGQNDTAIVGDEKDEKVLKKYKDAGYSVLTTPRIGGISGTAAREAIMKNDRIAMSKLLTPEGLQYIDQHIETLQKRPKLLDSILAKFVKNSESGRGVAGRLSSVMSRLSTLPARKTKTTPPETVALMESLRKERDDLTSKLGRRPARMLARLESRSFASGGTVPALVSNGEAFVPPETARKIGYSTLGRMNQADRNGMSKFADGGISIFKGPGSGTSDSIGPVGLPVGGFVIRAAATKALGLNKGGTVQRLAFGGAPRAVPNITGMNDTQALAVVGVVDTVTNQLQGLAEVLQKLGVRSSDSSRIIQSGTQATYQQAIRAAEADIRRARLAGATAEQIADAENQLANIRRQAQRDIQTRRTLGGLSGTQLQQIESDADRQRTRIIRRRTNTLRASGLSQEDIDTQLRSEAGDINNIAYGRAARRQGINLAASGLNGNDAQRFVRQSMGDSSILKQMDTQYVAERRRAIAAEALASGDRARASRIRAGLDKDVNSSINDEIRARRQIVNNLARQKGQQAPGGDPSRSNLQGVMGFAFGLQGIGSLLAQQINAGASVSNASSAGMIQGATSGLATGAMLTSGISDLVGDKLGPTMGKLIPIFGGIATVGTAIGQAFIDARNAVIEFEKNAADKRAQDAMEKVSKGFDKLSSDLNNLDIQKDITRNLVDASKNVSSSINVDKNMPKAFWANIIDVATASSGDQNAAAERSKILEKQGIGAYASTITGFGMLRSDDEANQRRNQLVTSMIPETAREDSKKYGEVAQGMQKIIEDKLRSGINVSQILSAPEHEFEQFAKTMAMADQATHAQILSVQADTALSANEKKEKINLIATLYAEDKIRKSAKTIDIEKQSKNFEKNINNLSRSLERMFQNMDQSIEKTSFSLKNMSDSMDLMTVSLGGQAKTGDTKLKTINVLQNSRAYGSTEANNARQQAASFFTGERNMVKGLLSVGDNLESSIMSTINKTLTENPGANNEQIGINIQKNVNSQLEKLQLPPDVSKKLGEQVKTALDQIRKRGDEKIDFGDLMEKIPGLSKVIESGRRAQEAALKALQYWQDSLNAYSERMNQLTDLQISTNEKLRRSTEIVTHGHMELAKVLGKDISVSMVKSARNVGISQRTGGITDPDAIFRNITSLESRRQNLEASSASAANRGMGGANDFMKFKNQLVDTNVALRENIEALKSLAESGDVAAAALSKVQEAQQKQSGRVNFLEKLVTSTPEEFASIGRAMGRLQNNINGQLNTINNSVGAQKAYNEAINNGATAVEAMQAAQAAFANERKETLGALNDLLPFLGNNQQANDIKANVLEAMTKESGIGMNPMIQQVLNSLRNPQSDPETQAAMQQYQAAINEQAKANTLLARLNETLAKDIAVKSAEALSQALTGATINFKNSQLDDIAQNVRAIALKSGDTPVPAPGKATGGIIYASSGAAIKFSPKGTDTVPAMLTPGEFVVNRKATADNLPLLRNINSGNYSNGGQVRYYSSGGYVSSSFKDHYKDKKNLQQSEKEYIDPDDPIIKDAIDGAAVAKVYEGWKNFTILQNQANTFRSGLYKSVFSSFTASDATDPITFDDNRSNIIPGYGYAIRLASVNNSGKKEYSEEYDYVRDGLGDLPKNADLGYLIGHNILNTKKISSADLVNYTNILQNLIAKVPLAKIWSGEYTSDSVSSIRGGYGGLPYNPNLSSSNPVGLILSKEDPDKNLRPTPAIGVPGIHKIYQQSKFNTGQTSSASNQRGNSLRIYGSINGIVSAGASSEGSQAPVPDKRPVITRIINDGDNFSWLKNDSKITELKKAQQKNIKLLKNTADDVLGNKIVWAKDTSRTTKLNSLQAKLEKLYEGGSLIEEIKPAERDIIDWEKLGITQPGGHFNILSDQLDAKLSQSVAAINDSGGPSDIDEDMRVALLTAAARARAGAWANSIPFSLEYNDGIRRKAAKNFPWISNKDPEYFLSDIKKLKEKQAKDIASGKSLGFDIRQIGLQDYPVKLPAPLDQVSLMYKAAYLKYTGRLYNVRDKELDDNRKLTDLFIIDPVKGNDDKLNIFRNADSPLRSFFTGFSAPYSPADLAKRVVVKDPRVVSQYLQALRNNNPNAEAIAEQIQAELILGPSLLKVQNRPSNMPEELFYGIENKAENIDISEYVVSASKNAAEEFKKLASSITSKVVNPGGLTDSLSDQDLVPAVKNMAQQSLSIFGGKPGIPRGLLYNMFGKAGYFATDPNKAKNIAGIISNVFGNVVGYINGINARNPKEFEALRDSNILATGASIAFGMLSAGNRTSYIKSFLNSSSSLEDLFRSLGSGAFSVAAGAVQLSNDFSKKLGANILKNGKRAKIGDDGSITLTEFSEQDIPKNYQGLVDLALNPYNEFTNRNIRKGLFNKLLTDIPNFRATYKVQDPKTGTVTERVNNQLPLFGPAALRKITQSLDSLRMWYGGDRRWLGQDYLNEEIPGTTSNDRAQTLLSNFDAGLYSQASEAHKYLGGLANTGNLPDRAWLMNRGMAKMPDVKPAVKLATGGMVYASSGTYVNFQPRGTDTVPAMLTPGEFVVNRSATQQHLPLLRAINNGASAYSNGGVVYAAGGFDPGMMAQGAYQSPAAKPSFFSSRNPGAFRPTPGRDTYKWIPRLMGRAGTAVKSVGTGLYNNFLKPYDDIKTLQHKWIMLQQGAAASQDPVLARGLVQPFINQTEQAIDAARASTIGGRFNSLLSRGKGALQTVAKFKAFNNPIVTQTLSKVRFITNNPLARKALGPIGTAIDAYLINQAHSETRSLIGESADNSIREERTRRMSGRPVGNNIRDISLQLVAGGERPISIDDHLKDLKPEEAFHVRNMGQLQIQLDDARKAKKQKEVDRLEKLISNERKAAINQGLYSNNYSIDRLVTATMAETRNYYAVRSAEEKASRIASKEKEKAEKERILVEANTIIESGRQVVSTGYNAAVRYGIPIVNFAMSTIGGLNNAREQARNAKAASLARNKQANEFLQSPVVPDLISKMDRAKRKKQEQLDIIANYEELQSRGFTDNKFAEESKAKYEAAKLEIMSIDNEIIALNQDKEKEFTYEERQNQWDSYTQQENKKAQDKRLAQARYERRVANEVVKRKAESLAVLAKINRLPSPTDKDKLQRPETFMRWRNSAYKLLEKKFGLTGNEQQNIDKLVSAGMSEKTATDIIRPIGSAEASILASMVLGRMSAQKLQTPKGDKSDTVSIEAAQRERAADIKALQLTESQVQELRKQGYVDSYARSKVDRRDKLLNREFVKTRKKLADIEKQAEFASRSNDPLVQIRRQQAIQNQLIKEGLVLNNADGPSNRDRLQNLGLGNNAADFIFNQNIGMPPQRMNRGGVVYAAGGMLVPYEPRGTDTVPAMLTPGEFVVNRSATQKHLPLLQSINKSSGGIIYRASGGNIPFGASSSGSSNLRTAQTNLFNQKTLLSKTDTINKEVQKVNNITNKTYSALPSIKSENLNNFDKLNSVSVDTNKQISKTNEKLGKFGEIWGFSSGGMVYAADGTLVNYEPRGTDTVPAMLTPGEFVVNAKATRENLPLLQSINKNSGGVIYRAVGGGVSNGSSPAFSASSSDKSSSIRREQENTRLQQQIVNNTQSASAQLPVIAKNTYDTSNSKIPGLLNKTTLFHNDNVKSFQNLDNRTSQISKMISGSPSIDEQKSQKLDDLLRMSELSNDHTTRILEELQRLPLMNNQLTMILALLMANGGPVGAGANPPVAPVPPPAGPAAPPGLAGAPLSKGGIVYASTGGRLSKGTDTIPAMLTPGEYVVNKQSADKNLNILNAINKAKGDRVSFRDLATSNLTREQQKYLEPVIKGSKKPAYSPNGLDARIQAAETNQASNQRKIDAAGDEFESFKTVYRRAFPKVSYGMDAINAPFFVSKRTVPEIPGANGASWMKYGNIALHPKQSDYDVAMHEMRHSTYAYNNRAYQNVPADALYEGNDTFIPQAVASYNSARMGLNGVIPNAMTEDRAKYLLKPTEIDVRLGLMAQVLSANESKMLEELKASGIETPSNRQKFDYFMRHRKALTPNSKYKADGSEAADYDFYNSLSEAHKDMFAIRMSELYSEGGIVYAQEGFDPSRQLNPGIYNHGKGPYTTLTPSPLNQFASRDVMIEDLMEGLSEAGKQAESFGYGAAKSVIPGAASLGAGLLSGPGAIPAGILTYLAVAKAQDNYLEALAPDTSHYMNKVQEDRPISSFAGSIVGGGPAISKPLKFVKNTFRPGFRNVRAGLIQTARAYSNSGALTKPINLQFLPTIPGLRSSIVKSQGPHILARAAEYGAGGLYDDTMNIATSLYPKGTPVGQRVMRHELAHAYQAYTKLINSLQGFIGKTANSSKWSQALSRYLAEINSNAAESRTIPGQIVNALRFMSSREYLKFYNNYYANSSIGNQYKAIHTGGYYTTKIMQGMGLLGAGLGGAGVGYQTMQGSGLNIEDAPGFDELIEVYNAQSRMKSKFTKNMMRFFDKPQTKSSGGPVYASRGTLVHYQPRGTDTVPAMLTPGEFVVNRSATQQHLPLLQAINNGNYLSRGGTPGSVPASVNMVNSSDLFATLNLSANQFTSALTIATKTLQQYNQQLSSGVTQNSVSNNNGAGNAVNLDGLSQFTSIFSKFIGQLEKLNLPPVIQMQGTHTVNVVINGGEAFRGMEEGIKEFVINEINSSMSKLSRGTEGAIPTYQA